MKAAGKIIDFLMILFLLNSVVLKAQCTSISAHNSSAAPEQGNGIKLSSCIFAGEYVTLSNVSSGNTYSVSSTVMSDYFTIRIGSANGGTVVASGSNPLVWTASVSGTFFILCNSTSTCGTENIERDIYFGCLGPACVNTNSSVTNAAPSASNTALLATCQNAGEYATLTNVAAANIYVSNSSVAGDYYTIRSGTFNGPVVATGPAPLTWTAQVAGTHYVHINTNSVCATQTACRANSITCLGLITAPANDLCSNASSLTVPGTSTGTTVYASNENPAPGTCGTTLNQPGVWYRVTGNGNQFGADLCASSTVNTKVFVYTGSCGNWTCVTGNDNNGPLCSGSAASATWCSIPAVDYFILVTSNCGADAFTLTITQNLNPSIPTVTVSAASYSVCLNLSTTLTASGASTYSWNTGATTASISVTPTSTSVYTVTGRAAVGCGYDIKTVTVTSLPNPTITLSLASVSICPGDSAVITAGGANSYTFNGASSGSFVSSTGNATLSPLASSVFSVFGTATNGCISSATVSVNINPLPALLLASTNTFLCAGSSATLTASGANNYTWTTGSNSFVQVVNPTVNTVYGVSGDNAFGCVKTLTLAVNVNTIVMTVSSNTSICKGGSMDLSATGVNNYAWAPIPFPFGNVTVTPSVTTSYTVTGTDSKNCLHTAVITVSVNPNPVVSSFASPSLICVGESATLTSTGANNYLWSSTTSSINTGSQLVVTPMQANMFYYLVTGTDTNECSGTDTVMVKVEKCTGITSVLKTLNQITVYPNPNKGSFKVEWINGLKKSISVTDLTGRLIYITESSEDVMDVNLNAFANGIYYLKVQSESIVEVIRVIKQ